MTDRLISVGKIKPKTAKDVKYSRFGVGFEKLDRDVFDPEKAYAGLAGIGVKRARLQSGWQRTERQKGVYDFAWLDSVVDNLLAIGVEPWLCFCYGNDLYSEEAKQIYGAVGVPPIYTEEEKTAWRNYVQATVRRYKGKIHYYEVWNEPDGLWRRKNPFLTPEQVKAEEEKYAAMTPAMAERTRNVANGWEYAKFTTDTALACKEADPTCEVIGLALAFRRDFAAGFCAAGGLEHIDAVTYHSYNLDEGTWVSKMQYIRDLLIQHKRTDIKIIQGESGTQSRPDGHGALMGGAWTPLKQSKYLLRHLITDMGLGVEFASYFSCVDMIEALDGTVGDKASYLDYGYFGVLGADFDEEGRSVGTYSPKPAYYALQNLCSALAEHFETCDLPVEGEVRESKRMRGQDADFNATSRFAFRRANGSRALFYWMPKDILTETYEGTVTLRLKDEVRGQRILLTDMLDGTVYELGEYHTSEEGVLLNIPVKDSPYMLTFGDFFDWEETK